MMRLKDVESDAVAAFYAGVFRKRTEADELSAV